MLRNRGNNIYSEETQMECFWHENWRMESFTTAFECTRE